jgi:hypothetical protein
MNNTGLRKAEAESLKNFYYTVSEPYTVDFQFCYKLNSVSPRADLKIINY